VMQAQIRNTIEEHLEKEIELKDRDMRTLAWFQNLNSEGAILSSFKPEHEDFSLELEKKYQPLEAEVIDAIRKYDFSRRIENKKKTAAN
jgi:hypothetical protein